MEIGGPLDPLRRATRLRAGRRSGRQQRPPPRAAAETSAGISFARLLVALIRSPEGNHERRDPAVTPLALQRADGGRPDDAQPAVAAGGRDPARGRRLAGGPRHLRGPGDRRGGPARRRLQPHRRADRTTARSRGTSTRRRSITAPAAAKWWEGFQLERVDTTRVRDLMTPAVFCVKEERVGVERHRAAARAERAPAVRGGRQRRAGGGDHVAGRGAAPGAGVTRGDLVPRQCQPCVRRRGEDGKLTTWLTPPRHGLGPEERYPARPPGPSPPTGRSPR